MGTKYQFLSECFHKNVVLVFSTMKYLYSSIFTYIFTVSLDTLFFSTFFGNTCFPKMLFELPIKYIYTRHCSYIYELSHGILSFYFFLETHVFRKCCLNYHQIYL